MLEPYCYCQPITPSSFEIEFEFRVDGKSNNLYGDGFAMWLTKDRAQFGPVFGSSGTRIEGVSMRAFIILIEA